jgi:hypothetical protein
MSLIAYYVTVLVMGSSAVLASEPPWGAVLGNPDIHPMMISATGVPEIPVSIKSTEVHLYFDTGNAGDLCLTTVLEKKVAFELLGASKTYNGDGSYRGDIKRIALQDVGIFGSQFPRVTATMADWRLYSGKPFEGLVGLQYFSGKRITLDYKRKLIGVTAKPLPESILTNTNYIILPMLPVPDKHRETLIYVEGWVIGQRTAIYLDTGIVPSHADPKLLVGAQLTELKESRFGDLKTVMNTLPVRLGSRTFDLMQVYVKEIRDPMKFECGEVGLVMGSDQLARFLVTIDLVNRRLILAEK